MSRSQRAVEAIESVRNYDKVLSVLREIASADL